MFKVRRIAVSNIGYSQAYYEGQILDCTHPNTGLPIDTILHAPNGTGKTTLLSFIFSVFDTDLPRFLNTLVDPRRKATDYYASGQPGLIAVEWQRGEEILVTGQIGVFRDDELHRYFFSFISDETLSLNALPFPGMGRQWSERMLNRDQVKAWLAATDQKHRDSNKFFRTDKPSDWRRYLSEVERVDIMLLSWMVDLNRAEGGMKGFLDFKTEQHFIDRFLDMVLSTKDVEDTQRAVREGVRQLGEWDNLQVKLDLLATFETHFAPFAASSAAYLKAEAALKGNIDQAKALYLGLAEEQTRLGSVIQKTEVEIETARGNLRDATSHVAAARTTKQGAQAALADIRLKSAEERKTLAEKNLGIAKNRLDEFDAAWALRPIIRKQAEVAELGRQMAIAGDDLAGRRLLVQEAGDVLLASLGSHIGSQERRSKEADKRLEDVRHAQAKVKEEQNGLNDKREALAVTERECEIALSLHDQEQARLIEAAIIGPDETGEAALARLRFTHEEGTEQLSLMTETIESARQRLDALTTEARETEQNVLQLEAKIPVQQEVLDEGLEQCRSLVENELMRSVVGTVQDLGNPAVISALAEERDNILQYVEPLRSRLANNVRDVEAISRHELAGIDENVERVIDLLVKHGIRDVLPYAVWLSKQGLDAAAMRDFAVKDPGVFSGVSVPGDTMLTKARALMGTDIGLLRPVTVSVGRLTPLVGDDPVVFDAVRAEAYDRDSALKLRDSLDEKQEELRKQISDAQSKSAAVDDLIRAIGEFNKKGGHARLASLQQEVAEMVGRKDSLRGILLMSRTTIKATEGQIADFEGRKQTLAARLQEYVRDMEDLRRFIENHEKKRPTMVARLAEARHGLVVVAEELEKLAEREKGLSSQHELAIQFRTEVSNQLKALQKEKSDVQHRDCGKSVLPTDIESARLAYSTAEEAYTDHEKAVMGDLGQRVHAARSELKQSESEFTSRFGLATEQRRSLADNPMLQQDHERQKTECDASDESLKLAMEGWATAKATAKDANKGLSQDAERLKKARLVLTEADLLNEVGHLEGQIPALEVSYENARQALTQAEEQARVVNRQLEVVILQKSGLENAVGGVDVGATRRIAPEKDAEALMAQVRRAIDAVRHAKEEVGRLFGSVARGHKLVVAFASDEKFKATFPKLGDIAFATPEDAARNAEHQASRLKNIVASLRDELEKFEAEQTQVIARLDGLVKTCQRLLRLLSEKSEIPAEVPRFGGQKFITLSADFHSLGADARSNVLKDYLRSLVQRQEVPSGHTMATALLAKMLEACGRKSFDIRLLKPTDAGKLEHLPVTETKPSGGEGLTAAILLWLSLCRLRATNLGLQFDGTGGALLLDNPIGTANHTLFLQTQREMARVLNIQLLFTTGLDDHNAIGEFPHVLKFGKFAQRLTSERTIVQVAREHIGEPRKTDHVHDIRNAAS